MCCSRIVSWLCLQLVCASCIPWRMCTGARRSYLAACVHGRMRVRCGNGDALMRAYIDACERTLQPTVHEFKMSLQEKIGINGRRPRLDIALLGRIFAGACCLPPTWCPIQGVLGQAPKAPRRRGAAADGEAAAGARGATKRAGTEAVTLVRPETQTQLEEQEARNASRPSQLYSALQGLLSTSLAKTAALHGGKSVQALPAVPALFDPWSYSQTVCMRARSHTPPVHGRVCRSVAALMHVRFSGAMSGVSGHARTCPLLCMCVVAGRKSVLFFLLSQSQLVRHDTQRGRRRALHLYAHC